MSSRKVLGAAAALALTLPLVTPATSFAQGHGRFGGGGMVGAGAMHAAGPSFHAAGPSFHAAGPSFHAAAPSFRGPGPSFAASPAMRGSSSFAAAPAIRSNTFAAPTLAGRSVAAAGPTGTWTHSGTWNGGTWQGRHWRHHHGGFWPGFAVGATVGALGSYAYYGGDPYYYDDAYYDNGYYDSGYYDDGVTVAADVGGDSVAYCAQRYRSYDPASGTYLGYDGLRHPCP